MIASKDPFSRWSRRVLWLLLAATVALSGCSQAAALPVPLPTPGGGTEEPQGEVRPAAFSSSAPGSPAPTPFPERPRYQAGELVEYVAQTGDTLPALAVRFNTTVEEILAANSFIPASATTMPSGMPMQIPIYYRPLWGSPYRILPDSLFVNGPAQVGFDTIAFVDSQPGWLKSYVTFVSDQNRTGGAIVDFVARNYSVSPRLLLALLEFQAGALSQPELPPERADFPLGHLNWEYKGVYMQLVRAANLLNNAYYGYRTASLTSLEYRDGRISYFDPWQNAASAALQAYFNRLLTYDDYQRAIAHDGFAATYLALFGDPWAAEQPHLPGSLAQPEFLLPFEPGAAWAYTGGPHTGWGNGPPFAALDFAPPSVAGGCLSSSAWVTAVADGVVVRSEVGQVMLDLDGDGDEHTGWNVFYLHVGTEGRAPLGAVLQRGDPLGHPSCEGGTSTGTHVHIARKYNGEWMLAEGLLGFNMEGWVANNGSSAYYGTLTRFRETVTACTCSDRDSFITARPR